GRHDAGAGVRLLTGQHVPGRGDLRLARSRRVRDRIDLGTRHARHSGRHPVHRAGVRGRQPGRGHSPGRHRPEDPAAMIEAPTPLPAQASAPPRGEALRRGLRANPLLVAGAVLSVLVVLVAVFAPLLAPYPADAGSATHPFMVLRPPSAQHWFGTDNVGRDVYSRVLYGARISPLIAVVVLALACVIGVPLGIAAGYFGGGGAGAGLAVAGGLPRVPVVAARVAWGGGPAARPAPAADRVGGPGGPWVPPPHPRPGRLGGRAPLRRELPRAGHLPDLDHLPPHPAQ